MITRPMLAATLKELSEIDTEPRWLIQPKIDGIRCLIHPEYGVVSRSFKPIPNLHIQKALSPLIGQAMLDGEITLNAEPDTNENSVANGFNNVQSAVMSRYGVPKFVYNVFDVFSDPDVPMRTRVNTLNQNYTAWIRIVPQIRLVETRTLAHGPQQIIGQIEPDTRKVTFKFDTVQMLQLMFSDYLSRGYEGMILRHPEGIYKSGRSTLRQGYLLKYKVFQTAEATVTGCEQLYVNDATPEIDAFGLQVRPQRTDERTPLPLLGALIVKNDKWGTFNIGTGFDDTTRRALHVAHMRGELIGKVVEFKYQSVGMQDKPRFPVFLRFREPSL